MNQFFGVWGKFQKQDMRKKTKHWKSGGKIKITIGKEACKKQRLSWVPRRGAQKLVKSLDTVWKKNGKQDAGIQR